MATYTIDKEIDARGSACPGPMLELIRGIKSVTVGSTVALLSTDSGSAKDIPIWVGKAGHELVALEQEANFTRFVVRRAR